MESRNEFQQQRLTRPAGSQQDEELARLDREVDLAVGESRTPILVDVFKLKLFSFVLSAVVTGFAGSIYFIYQKYIEPTSAFNIRWTMILMLSTVIGGIGTETGPVVGTIIVVFLHFYLAKYAGWSLLLQGVMLVIVMLMLPRGIVGFALKHRE